MITSQEAAQQARHNFLDNNTNASDPNLWQRIESWLNNTYRQYIQPIHQWIRFVNDVKTLLGFFSD